MLPLLTVIPRSLVFHSVSLHPRRSPLDRLRLEGVGAGRP